ncbi:MAG TPA: RES family NAD+ phosphorylase [Baekduia sp.]
MSGSDPAVWRLGHRDAPLAFVPLEHCGWEGRWDDPRRAYRTLYAARDVATCLREVLADLRPDTAMLAELRELFGRDAGLEAAAGTVPREFRDQRVVAAAYARADDGELVDIDAPAVRAELERDHAPLLAEHGMRHLDVSEIRSRTRVVSQRIGRVLYENGAAGIAFGSNLDDRPCYAVFEARGRLVRRGRARPLELTEDLPELVAVCAEYGLRLTG